jgi:hypothetical protein
LQNPGGRPKVVPSPNAEASDDTGLAATGASAYFMGGAVVYTRASRTELLRVSEAEFAAMADITPSTEPYALLFARKIKERLDTTLGDRRPLRRREASGGNSEIISNQSAGRRRLSSPIASRN